MAYYSRSRPRKQRGTYTTPVERIHPSDPDADYTTDVRVSYVYYPGYPDSWEEPGADDCIEVDVLEPIGFALTDEEEQQIGRQIIEGLY